MKVTTESRPYLGAALGTEEYTHAFVTGKVLQWAEELQQLTTIAHSQPHAAYAMTSNWTYFTCTMPGIGPYLLPLKEIIRTKLILALTCRPPPNDTEHVLLVLPVRLGGIALANPTQATDTEFLFSTKITEALKEAILQQDFQYTSEVVAHQLQGKTDVHKQRRDQAMQVERTSFSHPQAVHGSCSRKRSLLITNISTN